MRVGLAVLLAGVLAAGSAFAQSPVPERRMAMTSDIDFAGNDLAQLFDITLDACITVCLADDRCTAFTYNQRSGACFPKSNVTQTVPYSGAVSGRVVPTDAGVLRNASARAADLAFLDAEDLAQALSMAQDLPRRHFTSDWSEEELRAAALRARREGSVEGALSLTGQALAMSDAADLWLDYADLSGLLARQSRNERRTLQERALSATLNGYLRATSAPLRATAAFDMAQALEALDRGRDMIGALRLSDALSPGAQAQAALDEAIGKYGFRVIGTEVESDAAAPRICADFSEPLAEGGVDYSPFVQTASSDLAAQASGNRLCLDGVKHGERYQFTLRAGLPSADGEVLAKPVALTQYVRDRRPSVRFSGQAYVLPRAAGVSVPVVAVNTQEVRLALRRVSDRNIVRTLQEGWFGQPMGEWEERQFTDQIAEEIWTGTGQVSQTLNRDVTTQLPLGDVLADQPPGVYALRAYVEGSDAFDISPATQWFLLSDLGLTTLSGSDGLHVMVRALSDAGSVTGAEVALVSEGNRVLGTASTDANGYARFDAGLTRGTGAAAPAMVTVRMADDFTFLSLRGAAFDLSDRGVEGREPSGPVDIFMVTDRGAYRAGEVIELTVLARDGGAAAVTDLPLTVIVTRADGVEYSRHLLRDGGAGGAVASLPIGADVPRGTWRVAVHTDVDAEPLAQTTVLVEDFLPERLDMTLALPDVLDPSVLIPVQVDYLFGAAGADLPLEGEVRLTSRRTLEGFAGYQFGRYDVDQASAGRGLPNVRTGETGAAMVPLVLPEMTSTGAPLEARVTLRVTEGSGRPVERSVTRPVTPAGALIGVRPLEEGVLPEGGTAAFDLIAVGANAMPVRWTVNRVEQRYQWFQSYGSWNWEPVTTRSRISTGTATLGSAPVRVTADVDWGEYEILVERDGTPYLATSLAFTAGWYAHTEATGTPDLLEVSLDRAQYAAGDTARLRIVPREAGVAVIRVMTDRLIDTQIIEVGADPVEVTLPVTDDWGAGAYVSVQVIRPMDVDRGQNPTRALGLTHAGVDPAARLLRARLDVPDRVAPRGPLTATLEVPDASGPVYATVAAVDVGILNLTGFTAPDPASYFFGQRKLGMEIRDIYGRLIDGFDGAAGSVRSGGDAGGSMRMQAPPPTEALVAFHSGLITLDAQGRAEVSFDIPDFNGTVRLMAVVWSDTGVGQAQHDVLVRDPVVVTASVPRFLSPDDTAVLRMELTHADGPTGRVSVDISASAGLRLGDTPQGFDLAQGEVRVVSIPVTAVETGLQTIALRTVTPDGTVLDKTLMLPVQRNDPSVARRYTIDIAAGQTLTLTGDIFAGLVPEMATRSAGPLGRFDVPGLLAALDRYPYGCTEQVVSGALPLLAFGGLADAMGLEAGQTAAARIDAAIGQVLARQAGYGGFGLWRAGDDGAPWLDAYVTDFLSRAKAQGHSVPDLGFRTALETLRNQVNYAADFDNGGEALAYALMVLAREGAAAIGDLRYYADVKADDFATPLAQAQLGAALAFYGDQTRADRMFARAMARIGGGRDADVIQADFGTSQRDAAAMLALAVSAGSMAVDRDALIARMRFEGPLSTQEQAWSLMAAAALQGADPLEAFSIDGVPVTGPMVRRLPADLASQPVQVTNRSGTAQMLHVTAFGVPNGDALPGGTGYSITRSYYDLDGGAIDPSDVAQGTRMVAVLRVQPLSSREGRLIVADPLPAGFEIDNPSLLRGGDIRALDWLTLDGEPQHVEFRQDRFIAAVDHRGSDTFDLAYIVRAVSVGTFHHPAASVEDMYRAEVRAQTAGGTVRVR